MMRQNYLLLVNLFVSKFSFLFINSFHKLSYHTCPCYDHFVVLISNAALLFMTECGEVWVWGFGMLGLGPEATRETRPCRIPPPLLGYNTMAHSDHRITALSSGLFCLAALSSNGDLYTWGRNKDSCLGLGHKEDQPFPLRVSPCRISVM
jgi:alpha-tubulin suppressor-like RCC1 family protein